MPSMLPVKDLQDNSPSGPSRPKGAVIHYFGWSDDPDEVVRRLTQIEQRPAPPELRMVSPEPETQRDCLVAGSRH